jgi:hypothetical protein
MLQKVALLCPHLNAAASYEYGRITLTKKRKLCKNPFMKQIFNTLAALGLALFVTACANQPVAPIAAANPQLEFIDLAGFDHSLNASLGAKLPEVNVAVVNAITATTIPPRIQTWLEAVESGGGKVTVTPPKSTVVSKNPLLLLSLISGIWNTNRAAKAIDAHTLHKSARNYNAEILLKIDDKGERLIDKIIFTERKPV